MTKQDATSQSSVAIPPEECGCRISLLLRSSQLRDQIVGRLDVAKGHQELAQRVIVQRIRIVGVAVRYHDRAVAVHGSVARSRFTGPLGDVAVERPSTHLPLFASLEPIPGL